MWCGVVWWNLGVDDRLQQQPRHTYIQPRLASPYPVGDVSPLGAEGEEVQTSGFLLTHTNIDIHTNAAARTRHATYIHIYTATPRLAVPCR